MSFLFEVPIYSNVYVHRIGCHNPDGAAYLSQI